MVFLAIFFLLELGQQILMTVNSSDKDVSRSMVQTVFCGAESLLDSFIILVN